MHRTHHPGSAVCKEHRYAVGHEHGQGQVVTRRDETIGLGDVVTPRCVDDDDLRPVALVHEEQALTLHAN